MSLDTLLTSDEHGDAKAELVLHSAHDIFRFAINMLGWQCEFGAAGRALLVQLREQMGAGRFDAMATTMLGADGYARFAGRFERDPQCVVCAADLSTRKRYPAGGSESFCRDCSRLYKRSAGAR
jgi:hypothetical protein